MEKLKKNPLVSVIVPVYNVEKYVHECVGSIVAQTYSNLEIILVDDGSPDSCPQICDSLAESDARIKVIHKKNGGLGFARNSGLDIATGEYVVFVDSDDYLADVAIETLVRHACCYGCQYVKAAFKKINDNGIVLYEKEQESRSFDLTEIEYNLRSRMLGSSPSESDSIEMSVWATLYDRQLIERNNLRFDSERNIVSEDLPFNLSYLSYCRSAALIKDKIYCYRYNPDSLTEKYVPNKFNRIVDMFNTIEGRFPELTKREATRFSRLFFVFLRKYIKLELIRPNANLVQILRGISNICNNQKTKSLINNYPINQLNLKQRAFVYLVKYDCSLSLFILSKLGLM